MVEPTPPKGKPYATSIPSRSPEVKVYDTLSRAKASFRCTTRYVGDEIVDGRWQYIYAYPDAAMYEWDGQQWVEIYRVHQGDNELPWNKI